MYKSEYSEVEEDVEDGCVRVVESTEIEEESTSITYVDPEGTTHSESLLLQTKKRTTEWIAASLLPVYTEKLTTSPELGRMEKAIAACTMYGELKTACVDSHYEKVFSRLQMEWTYTGGTVSFPPLPTFPTDSFSSVGCAFCVSSIFWQDLQELTVL